MTRHQTQSAGGGTGGGPDIPTALRSFLDAINCGAMLLDRAGRIVHANDRLCRLLDRPAGEVVGQTAHSFYQSPEAIEHIRARIERFDEADESEFHLPTPDGRIVPVILSGKPLGGEPPHSNLRLVTVIDITRQKEAERRAQDEFDTVAKLSDTVISQALDLKHHSEELERRVRERTRELHAANMDTIYMLAVASEAKDADTGDHVRRIQRYTEVLSRGLGLSEKVVEEYGYSSILHDVGKMSVADQILKKPGPLDSDERKRMEEHCIAGERILSTNPFFETARRIARSHHENWDGSGYPDGLAGEQIPQAARIVHLVDVYDALTSRRVYKPPWTADEAAAAIIEGPGTAFDPRVVAAFKSLHGSGEIRPARPAISD